MYVVKHYHLYVPPASGHHLTSEYGSSNNTQLVGLHIILNKESVSYLKKNLLDLIRFI